MGADVITVDRLDASGPGLPDPMRKMAGRGRRSIAVDLKAATGPEVVLRLTEASDVLVEGFRPGVAERIGVGPDECLGRNPRLVYGRMTGWGQEGPMAQMAGHDINYIGLTGGLGAIGRAGEPPVPPLNLVGDYGGGALYLAMGILAALVERSSSGEGQVVDAAMVDGSASLMTIFYQLKAAGMWDGDRGHNILDGGAHFYDTYGAADGKYLAVGPIEPQFYAEFIRLLALDQTELPAQLDASTWEDMHERIGAVLRTRPRDEWAKIFDGSDACVTPILDLDEAPLHPHNVERGAFVEVDGVMEPAPAPRFSRTQPRVPKGPADRGEHTDAVLADAGFARDEIEELRVGGVVG